MYKNVKAGCKLDGGCKIVSHPKTYNGSIAVLSSKAKLLKLKLTCVKIRVEASATACDVELMVLCV